jgi:alpha-L-fucosidase
MKKSSLLAIFFFGLLSLLISSCNSKDSTHDNGDSHSYTWQEQKYSMFIHWGLYAIPAGIWNGEKVNGYSEQIKGHAKIPTQEYRALASKFNPTQWNPTEVARLAKEAGMKSIVITAKHHDGFCMFNSEYTQFDVVDATPYGKDVLKDLSEACKQLDLKFGIYFSLIDWDYEGALPFTSVRNSDSIPPLHHEYNMNQIEELLSNYGDISELWFDMGSPTRQQSVEMAKLVKSLQPNCMVSGRIWNDQGDFAVMGDNKKPDFKMGTLWQTPASMFNETWSYRSWQERNNLPEKINEKIQDLIYITCSGGNYLLNIGPKANGEIVHYEKEVLLGVGDWLKKNGEAIYATTPISIACQDWGYISKKDNKLYLHIIDFPKNNRLEVKGIKSSVINSYFLQNKDIGFQYEQKGSLLTIDVSGIEGIDNHPYVVVLTFEDERIEFDNPLMLNPENDNQYLLSLQNSEQLHSYSGHDYYSSKSTVVRLNWYLPELSADSCLIKLVFKDEMLQPLDLSINEVVYTLEPSMGKDFILKLDTMETYSDRNNTISLSLSDKSTPHKDLEIKVVTIEIK